MIFDIAQVSEKDSLLGHKNQVNVRLSEQYKATFAVGLINKFKNHHLKMMTTPSHIKVFGFHLVGYK